MFASLVPSLLLPVPVVEAKRPDRGTPPGQVEAQRNDRAVEVVERRTAGSKTFRNPDGTLATQVYSKPIHYRDESGQYQIIQNTWVAEPGGRTIKNAANRYKASFTHQLGSEFLSFSFRGRSMSMDLEGARPQRANWQGGKLSYAEALENVDLIYSLGNDFVKEEIVLKAPVASPTWNFSLKLKGVSLDASPSGVLNFLDESTGEILWSMPRMFMRDAAGALSGAVAVAARQTGNTIRLTVVPDAAWLAAPERAYPVVIDPTIALQPDYMGGLDTTIAAGEGLQDTNLGYNSTLAVGTGYSSLLKFDLTAIPRASIIDEAKLTLSNLSAPPAVNATGVPAPAAAPVLSPSAHTSALTAGTYSVVYTYLTPQGETSGSPAGTISIGQHQGIDLSVGTLPTGVTGINVYLGPAGSERLVATSDLPAVTLTSRPDPQAPGVPGAAETGASYIQAPAAAPTATAAGAANGASGFMAGTYYVRHTWLNSMGETTASPAASVTLTDGHALRVTVGQMPEGVNSANIYVGTSADTVQKVGTILRTSGDGTAAFDTPPASVFAPAPPQILSILTSPSIKPTVERFAGHTAFATGDYEVVYTFFGPNGETAASPAASIHLSDGDYLKVTAGQAIPAHATGMRVYLSNADGPHYLGGTLGATLADSVLPWLEVKAPAGYRPIQPAAASINSPPASAPTLKAADLNTSTRLIGATYHVAYAWVYPTGESRISPTGTVTITDGQGIEVVGAALPGGAVGMRVYTGPGPDSLSLAAASTGSRALVEGDRFAPAAPVVDTANLPAPVAEPVSLSALPAGTYYVAYTATSQTSESAPSPVTSIDIIEGQGLFVMAGETLEGSGMNVYLGLSPNNLQRVLAYAPGELPSFERGASGPTVVVTALPAADATPMSSSPRGAEPPNAPIAGPDLSHYFISSLPVGTELSVRYVPRGTWGSWFYIPSQPTRVSVAPGQAINVRLPDHIAGFSEPYACYDIYIGYPGAEKKGPGCLVLGQSAQVSGLPSDTEPPVPSDSTYLPAVQSLTGTAGGNLSGDLYISYSYQLGGYYEGHRSPEVKYTAAGPNGTVELTTGIVPPNAAAVRVYVGEAPGQARLYGTFPATPGAKKSVSINRMVPAGVAIAPVSTPWTELDATWMRANANTLWYEQGGDFGTEPAVWLAPTWGRQDLHANLTALVRKWADGSMPNHGVLIHGEGAPVEYASSDHPDEQMRPVLTVRYREKKGPPRVYLTSPAPGQPVTGNASLTAQVIPPDPSTPIDRVEFFVNGAHVGTDTSAPYSVAWNTANLPAGDYQVAAKAYDRYGQEGSSNWSMVFRDTFDTYYYELDRVKSTVTHDPARGILTLPVSQTSPAVVSVKASSEKAAESYPAEYLLDERDDTFWRSPGQMTPDTTEAIQLDLTDPRTDLTLTVRPRNAGDHLTVKAQAIDSNGVMVGQSSVQSMSDASQNVSLHTSSPFTSVRLVFGNLKRDLASGRYHAEISEVSDANGSSGLRLAEALSYRATYEGGNALDATASTSWVSRAQGSPTAQEYLEVHLAAPANAFYLKPRTPGVSAMLARYEEADATWVPVLHVASLDEGTYPLPPGVTADRVRVYLTNLEGMAGPDAPNEYYGGLDSLVPYSMTLSMTQAVAQTALVTLPAHANRFRLEVDDSQPIGSSIQYQLYDGVTWHPITPGADMVVPAGVGMVMLRANLTSGSPVALPVLSAWRLYSYGAQSIHLETGGDTIAPVADLVHPTDDWVSGTISLNVATSDNVAVTKVELYVDSTVAPFATATKLSGDTSPYVLPLDTTTLTPGPHIMWAKAYDAAGNVSSSLPATTTYRAFTDSFDTYGQIDQDLSTHPVVHGGSLLAGTTETSFSLTGSGLLSAPFEAGLGLITAAAPAVADASGLCAPAGVQLTLGGAVVAEDQTTNGECREVHLAYLSTEPGSYAIAFSQGSAQTYKATVRHPGILSAVYPYQYSTVISAPTVTAGPVRSVKLTVTDRKPDGTVIRYWVSANDGVTWQQAVPGTQTELNHGGRKLRLRADLSPAATAGSAYSDLSPEVLDWSAEVTQFLPVNLITTSQVAPPAKAAAAHSGTKATVQWEASATPGVTYNVYRSESPHPEGQAYLVATGVPGTMLTWSSNWLKNASFERGIAAWNTYWNPDYAVDADESWAGLKSVRLSGGSQSDNGIFQNVAWDAVAGSTLTFSARVKGENVAETAPQAMGIALHYTDDTWSQTNWGGIPDGTYAWTTAQVSATAAKPVKGVRVTLRLYGSGTVWYDGVQLDAAGATLWSDGDVEPSMVYYYLITAVDANGVESAPSNQAATGAAVSSGMLGIKGFWPYSSVPLAGGNGYVNLASGNLAYAATDLVYPGRLLVTGFRRTYNSQGTAYSSTVGNGWDHNFNWTLTAQRDGTQTLKEGDGATFAFTPTDDGLSYEAPPGARMRLISRADGSHTLVRYDTNLLYEFDADGCLARIAEPNGNALTLSYNPEGTLSQVTDPSGSMLAFAYAGGRLASITHPGAANWQVAYTYDAHGNLTRVTDLEGQSVYYGYDGQSRLVQVTDELGRTTQVVYSGMPGVVQGVIYPDATEQTFAYGAVGDQPGWQKSTVTDARGFAATYQVDASGLLKRQTFPYGTASPAETLTGIVSFAHDAAWNLTRYTDPLGGDYHITYDGYGNVLSVTDPDGNRSSSLWVTKAYPGAEGQVLNVVAETTDAMNQSTVMTTDSRGNVTQIQDPLLHVTTYEYNEVGLRTAVKDANRHVSTYTYDSKGWLLLETDPAGSTTGYVYDTVGNPTVITDAAGNQTRYRYDRLGRQTEVTSADGSTQFYVYDGAGNLVQSTDPGGATARYEYDSLHRVVKLQQWPNAGDMVTVYTTRYEYDNVGLPVTVTDPLGRRTTTTYDGAGRTLTSVTPLDETTTYTYDSAGNVIQIEDPVGAVVTAEYDRLGRRTRTVAQQGPGTALVQAVTYDALGRTTAESDGLGNTTTYHYDALGRLGLVVDPMGFGTKYAYDAVGNMLFVTDAQRRTTHYIYDAADRVIEAKRPDGVSVLTTYDQAGRIIAETNGRNQTTGYRYDNRNRQVEIIHPSGDNVRFTYDAMGRRTSMTDRNGTTRYHYNLIGWLEESIDPWGHQVRYTYDAAGSRTRMNLHYGGADFTWTYGYDDAGRVTSLQAPGVPRPDSFVYDRAGRMERLTYANGDTVDLAYDLAGELTAIASLNSAAETLLQYTYHYDQAGRRTNITRSVSGEPEENLAYTYDAGGRLTSSGPEGSMANREYYYDLAGNRHTMTVNDGGETGVYTYVYDPVNRLLEEFGPEPGGGRYQKSQTYDGEGSLTRVEKDGKEVTLYYYDEESRLVQVTNPSGQMTRYTYNGDGRRISMTEARGKTFFIYDGTEVLAEADATGTIKIAYSRLPGGQLVSQWQGGKTFWYHLDGLGSTIAMTDESGQIRNRYGYDEYGNPTDKTSEQVFNRFTFTGQAWDASVGLYHYKARYYNPQAGRFLTQDTYKGDAWEPWTQNLYTYVGNNPVNYVDPTGHRADDSAGGGWSGPISGGSVGPVRPFMSPARAFSSPTKAFSSPKPASPPATTAKSFSSPSLSHSSPSPRVTVVTLSASKYPASAQHVRDAQAAGQPKVLTVDRNGADARRDQSTSKLPTKQYHDRDEYPPAIAKEGGAGASVKHVPSSDNRGAGASIGNQLRNVPNGGRFTIVVTPD